MRGGRGVALSVTAVAVSAVLAGCAVPDQGQPTVLNSSRPANQPSAVSRPATPKSAEIQVYFVNSSNQVIVVTRSDAVAGLSSAITALLAGPTSEEMAGGVSSAIPPRTKLDSVRQAGVTAYLDFSDALASVSGHEQLLAFAEIVLTADSLPEVRGVQISIAGQVVNAPEPNGTLAQGPVTRSDYTSLLAP